YASGEMLVARREYLKAAAYFERIYVVYGKYRELVAAAYLSRGQALENLAMGEKALAVYRELVAREDLAEFAEVKTAVARVSALERERDRREAELEEKAGNAKKTKGGKES
ncbi:MAG: hypothetical protein ACC661_06895, partial [Verrucomicrobiales bacterium]